MSTEVGVPRPSFPLLVQPREQFGGRRRAVETSNGAKPQELIRQARLLRMHEGALTCLQPRVKLAAHARHLAERAVSDIQREIVTGRLEYRQRLLDERGQPLGRALRLEEGAEQTLLDSPAQLTDAVAGSRGPLGEGTRAP